MKNRIFTFELSLSTLLLMCIMSTAIASIETNNLNKMQNLSRKVTAQYPWQFGTTVENASFNISKFSEGYTIATIYNSGPCFVAIHPNGNCSSLLGPYSSCSITIWPYSTPLDINVNIWSGSCNQATGSINRTLFNDR